MNEKPIPEMNDISKPYWDAVQREEFFLQRNKKTGNYLFIPRELASDDFSQDLEWVKASGKGEIATFSIAKPPLFEFYAAELPYVVAIIKLSEGPQMMSNIINCNPEDVHVGMNVKVTFEERKDGFKIPQFEPA
jgi:uncharacterized OB-fold protein